MTQDIESILRNHPFMNGLDPDHAASLARRARLEHFEPGAYIFHAGRPASACYLIRDGHVAVEIFDAFRGPITVQTLGEPNVLGWSWLMEPQRWCFDARATDPVDVIRLDAAELRRVCESDPRFGYALLKRFTAVFAKRLQAARFQLLDISNNLTHGAAGHP